MATLSDVENFESIIPDHISIPNYIIDEDPGLSRDEFLRMFTGGRYSIRRTINQSGPICVIFTVCVSIFRSGLRDVVDRKLRSDAPIPPRKLENNSTLRKKNIAETWDYVSDPLDDNYHSHPKRRNRASFQLKFYDAGRLPEKCRRLIEYYHIGLSANVSDGLNAALTLLAFLNMLGFEVVREHVLDFQGQMDDMSIVSSICHAADRILDYFRWIFASPTPIIVALEFPDDIIVDAKSMVDYIMMTARRAMAVYSNFYPSYFVTKPQLSDLIFGYTERGGSGHSVLLLNDDLFIAEDLPPEVLDGNQGKPKTLVDFSSNLRYPVSRPTLHFFLVLFPPDDQLLQAFS